MRSLPVLVLMALVACGSSDDGSGSSEAPVQASRPLSDAPRDGIATFYDADGSGNCSFDKATDLDVVAMAMPEYADSAACGACLRVTGPRGEVTVRVVDSCPPCAKSGVNLDLSESAFAKIAEPKAGRIAITYRAVSCGVSGSLSYHFKDGSSKYWTAIQVRNHKLPIEKLEWKKGSAWVEMKRESYNYFVEASGVGDGDGTSGLALRLTASDGQVIEDTVAGEIPSDRTVKGAKQFD